jgi:hypothetical protein
MAANFAPMATNFAHMTANGRGMAANCGQIAAISKGPAPAPESEPASQPAINMEAKYKNENEWKCEWISHAGHDRGARSV